MFMFSFDEKSYEKMYGAVSKEAMVAEQCISQCTGCMCNCRCSCSGGCWFVMDMMEWEVL